MSLLKISIPKEGSREITEIESWTVSWRLINERGYTSHITNSKVFIKNEEAKEFEKQLNESAKFIKSDLKSKIKKN